MTFPSENKDLLLYYKKEVTINIINLYQNKKYLIEETTCVIYRILSSSLLTPIENGSLNSKVSCWFYRALKIFTVYFYLIYMCEKMQYKNLIKVITKYKA